MHALVKIENNNYYLEDSKSKFGTLVQLNSEIMLQPNRTLALQLGKSFTSYRVEKTCLGFLKCYIYPKKIFTNYNNLIQENWKYFEEIVLECDDVNNSKLFSEVHSNENNEAEKKTYDYKNFIKDDCMEKTEEKRIESDLINNVVIDKKCTQDYEILRSNTHDVIVRQDNLISLSKISSKGKINNFLINDDEEKKFIENEINISNKIKPFSLIQINDSINKCNQKLSSSDMIINDIFNEKNKQMNLNEIKIKRKFQKYNSFINNNEKGSHIKVKRSLSIKSLDKISCLRMQNQEI